MGSMGTQAIGKNEINWNKLDKTKFYVLGAGLFTGITVALYPVSVIKTRLQVSARDTAEKNAFQVIKGILGRDGVAGLYRGFGTVITGAIPARIIFLTVLETTKLSAFRILAPLELSEPSQAAISNGMAGMMGSLCAQAVFVPVDVVSQKLMVQGYSGYASYSGGADVVRKVLKSEGIGGLYRGFGLSVATFAPGSAVWWATYGSSQRLIWRVLGYGSEHEESPSLKEMVCVQAVSGIVAGTTASSIITPLDTIKTRLQVQQGTHNRQNAVNVIRKLIGDEGWKGLYRGLGPKFFSASTGGTSMILAYEYLNTPEDVEARERIFKQLDKNGDGKISSTELGEALQTLGSATPEDINAMMEEIDTDRDGFISSSEFVEFAQKNRGLVREVAKVF